jgi:thiol:disulfide interchange protein DsbA
MKLRVVLIALALAVSPLTQAATTWVEGRNYFTLVPEQHPNVPAGKVQVTEVFSYGCPACNQFNPWVRQLRKSLPANAVLDFVPAGFIPAEAWPMYQRAYITAQLLGIADRTHDAIYDAVWKTGELANIDPRTQRPKSPLPSIEEAARYYNHLTGVSVDKFVATAKSFTVQVKVKSADAYVLATHVDGTPTIIVNGKYRLSPSSAGGPAQLIELVNFLVAKETPGAK